MVTITVVIGTVSISICAFILWGWIAKHKGNILTEINTMDQEVLLHIRDYWQLQLKSARKKKGREILLLNIGEAHKKFRSENMLGDNLNQLKVQELPLFDFEKLMNATNNFHQSNKLGQGGFGPVYRVMVVLLYVFCVVI